MSIFRTRLAAARCVAAGAVLAQEQKPNILVIFGDDIGMYNIGAYNRGMLAASLVPATSTLS
jgi:arylsulfatase